jgi:hypothetical protein
MPDDPGAELREDAVIEPWIVEPQPERVLPQQPLPHRLGGLPVGQVFGHLQHRDQRQPAR